MNKALKDKGIAALRSGDYKQGRGALQNKEGAFCCLGVLGDCMPDLTYWKRTNATAQMLVAQNTEVGHYDYSGATIPNSVREKIGLFNGDQAHLLYQNDSGASFQEIADWIEKNIPGED